MRLGGVRASVAQQMPSDSALDPRELRIIIRRRLMSANLLRRHRSGPRPNPITNHIEIGTGEFLVKGRKRIRRILAVVRPTNHARFVDPNERWNINDVEELRCSMRLVDQAWMRCARCFYVRADIFGAVECHRDGNETFGAKFFI